MRYSHAFFMIGIVLATGATISNILAFGLPSWIYTYEDDSTQGINYAGLWTFCLETFFDFSLRTRGKCDNDGGLNCFNDGVPMYGCHWIYSPELKEIRWRILNPEWYIAVQIMATVNLILALLSLFGLFFICAVRKHRCPLLFGIVSQSLCAILGLCEVVLYALRVKDDEYYKVPNIRAKSLGAGWGMAIVAFSLAAASMAALFISYAYDEGRQAAKALKKASRYEARQQQLLGSQPARRQYDY